MLRVQNNQKHGLKVLYSWNQRYIKILDKTKVCTYLNIEKLKIIWQGLKTCKIKLVVLFP